jgi:hypothetical protein
MYACRGSLTYLALFIRDLSFWSLLLNLVIPDISVSTNEPVAQRTCLQKLNVYTDLILFYYT